jgi:hypothetical protein
MAIELWELEAAVAKKIGVGRNVLIEYRQAHLEKNLHWRTNRKQVELSQDAIDRISTALGATAAPAKPDTHSAPPPAVPEEPVELEVVRIYPNPRLLAAKTADGRLVNVAVPRNKNFRPRMQIKARPPVNGAIGSTSLFSLDGRCPRYPGRW